MEYLFPQHGQCIPSDVIAVGIYQPAKLLRGALLNVSIRLLTLLHLPSHPCNSTQASL